MVCSRRESPEPATKSRTVCDTKYLAGTGKCREPSAFRIRPISSGRRRLAFDLRQVRIDSRPTRCGGNPDRRRRLRNLWIIESTNPYEDKMRSRFGFAEEMRAARGAKLAMHLVSAIGCRWIVAQFAGYFECRGRKCSIHCRPARADFLAVSAPAHTCGDWLCTDLIVHVPAQTST